MSWTKKYLLLIILLLSFTSCVTLRYQMTVHYKSVTVVQQLNEFTYLTIDNKNNYCQIITLKYNQYHINQKIKNNFVLVDYYYNIPVYVLYNDFYTIYNTHWHNF